MSDVDWFGGLNAEGWLTLYFLIKLLASVLNQGNVPLFGYTHGAISQLTGIYSLSLCAALLLYCESVGYLMRAVVVQ